MKRHTVQNSVLQRWAWNPSYLGRFTNESAFRSPALVPEHLIINFYAILHTMEFLCYQLVRNVTLKPEAGKATGCQFLFWLPLTVDQSWSSLATFTDRELSKAPHITTNSNAFFPSPSDSFLEGTLPNTGGCTG